MINQEDLLIVKMAEEHIDAMAELEKISFSTPWSKNAFVNAFNDSNYRYYVAIKDGIVVGMAGLIVSFEEADITNVAVAPAYKRQGIANSILTHIFSDSNNDDIKAYTLEVRKNNIAARRLYEKQGFINEGERPGFYDNPKEDAVIYWKRL